MDKLVIAGRLMLFKDNWSKISQDQWIRGYKIEFLSSPIQTVRPTGAILSDSQLVLVREEIEKLLTKGAITKVSQETPGFYSRLFLVPKKDGGMRPVIDLKSLNNYIPPHHFKMEGLHTLRDLLKKGDWMTKVDLKDAYFMIPFQQHDKTFLRFSIESQDY